jgi:hypothetical protein
MGLEVFKAENMNCGFLGHDEYFFRWLPTFQSKLSTRSSLLYSKYDGDRVVRIVGSHLQDYTAS